jgi:hypothetical protein
MGRKAYARVEALVTQRVVQLTELAASRQRRNGIGTPANL